MIASLRVFIKDFYELWHGPRLLMLLLVGSLGLLLIVGNLRIHPDEIGALVLVPEGDQYANDVSAVRDILKEFANVQVVERPDTVDVQSAVNEAEADIALYWRNQWIVYNGVRPGRRWGDVQAVAYQMVASISEQKPWQIVLFDTIKSNRAAAVVGSREANVERDRSLVPAFIALVVVVAPFLLACSAVVREKEFSTLGPLLVTPGQNWLTLLVGKALLPLFGGVVLFCVLLIFAQYWFDLPLRGAVRTQLGIQTLGIASSSALGLVLGSLIGNQLQGYFISAAYLLTSILLPGFLYPRGEAAEAIQFVSYIIPLSWTHEPLSAWMLGGAIGGTWMPEATALAVQVVGFSVIAAITSRHVRSRL